MKKILLTVFLLIGSLVLIACDDSSNDLNFTATVKGSIEVGESFTVTAKDSNVDIDAENLTITVKSGSDVIKVSGLTITGLKAGSAKIEVKYTKDSKSAVKQFDILVTAPSHVVGIPSPKTGFYMRDAALIEEDDVRYLVYLTNEFSGEEDHVIAIRRGEKSGDDYVYGDEKIIIKPSSAGWDKYLGSASIVKGDFEFNGTSYAYLIAYQATGNANNTSNSIGFAVANDPMGTWVKVGSEPIIEYDAVVYGESYVGYYAPSLINMNKESIIRVFFTWADAFGHFAYFVDINAANLNDLEMSGYAMAPNNGNLSSGDDVTMIPNADLAYDAVNGKFYMVKDYSPTPSQQPRVATRFELASIDELELYSAVPKNGWSSLRLYDMFDTPDAMYERLYSATIVKDAYGHLISASRIEMVYNVSDLAADNVNHVFSQHLVTMIFEN